MRNGLPFKNDIVKIANQIREFFVLIEEFFELPQKVSMLVTQEVQLVAIDLNKLVFEDA